jgi:LPS sulfotransferase NodH
MSTLGQVQVPADEAATTTPFFIVGSGRSGSTLLRLMLASHSRLTIPPETWYLIPLVRRFSVDRPLRAQEIEQAVAIITGHYRWPDMKLDAQEFRRQVSQLPQPHVRDLAEVVYRWHLQAEQKVRWGDKTPPYIEIVPQLAKMYPGTRFIHLVRDGRDVAKSFRATNWVDSRWLHDSTREWTRAMQWHWRWARSEFGVQILLVHYEELVVDPDTTLRRICRFLGEEFEPRMLAWQGIVDAQVPSREREWHSRLKQRIGAEGVARWKREMSAREIFICEAFMAPHLRRLGYELRYSSPLWRPLFAVTRLFNRALLPVLESVARRCYRLVFRRRSMNA